MSEEEASGRPGAFFFSVWVAVLFACGDVWASGVRARMLLASALVFADAS